MATIAASSDMPTPRGIFDALNAYQLSASLKAAIELDVFTEIARGHRGVEALARAVHSSERGVRILCDYLVISGFLTKTDQEYGLTPDTALFLDKESPAYLGTVARFLLDPRLITPFYDLRAVVQSGTTTLPAGGTVSPDNPIWIDFAKEMAPMMYPAAQEIAHLVAGEGKVQVLDIAAGHGLFGIMVAQRNPEAQITALDWPRVLSVASENAARFGVAERHRALPGDAFDAEFGGPYDLVMVTNFFHHFDQPACEKLMAKIHAALAPAGRCATLDFIPHDDRVSPHTAAAFAMMMLGSTGAGDAYTFAEYEGMFRRSGYAGSELHTLKMAPQSLVVSRA